MKLALRYIPAEVWVDVFCYPWIKRKKLGRIVHMFRNRKFVDILQYCLHERGKRTLGNFYLDKQRLPCLPRSPLPENIKFFKYIRIRHVDAQTLGLLRQFNPLFTGVNLDFEYYGPEHDLTNLRSTLLDHLAPLIHGIHSLELSQSTIPLVQEYFGPKLEQVKRMKLNNALNKPLNPATCITFLVNWLTMGDCNEPRFLEMSARYETSNPTFFQQFAKAIQEQFQSAKNASTFAIHIDDCYGHIHHITGFHLVNNLGEQLHGQLNYPTIFQIVRHQPNAGKELQEWIWQIVVEKLDKSSVLDISWPLTIGQIEAIADANEEDGKQGGDQPSTSNK